MQVEAVRRGAICAFPVSGVFEELAEAVERFFAPGDLIGLSDEQSDHAIKESRAPEGEEEYAVRCFCDGCLMDGAGVEVVRQWMGFVASLSSKGPVIVRAFEEFQCMGEQGFIQIEREVPCQSGKEGWEYWGTADFIDVGFALGTVARVKVVGDAPGLQYAYGGRQVGIQCKAPAILRDAAGIGCMEMEGLAFGVYSGVRSSRCVDADGCFQDGCDGPFQGVLYGVATGLTLPAFVAAPVIGDGEEVSRHEADA